MKLVSTSSAARKPKKRRSNGGCFGLKFENGDLLRLGQRPYVTHSGLLRLAQRKGCVGIQVRAVTGLCQPAARRWVFEAVVFPNQDSKGFSGFGDADPWNVAPELRGAELRIAETRAVNRALRKAYGVGMCSYEELGAKRPRGSAHESSDSIGEPAVRLRDQLAGLIRGYGLEPESVKRYAAEFCNVATLKEARRADVERFVAELSNGLRQNLAATRKHLAAFARRATEEPAA